MESWTGKLVAEDFPRECNLGEKGRWDDPSVIK